MNAKSGSMICVIAVLLLIGCLESEAQQQNRLLGMFMGFREMFFNMVGRTGTPRGLRRAAQLNKLQPVVDPNVPFPCNTSNFRSKTKPKTVHELRPGDIDIIAAMGDSLTAGNGAAASNLLHITTENRGISWSIGGQGTWREYLTLPNILKEFNPNIMGYSLADSLTHQRASQFNVAEAGSMSRDMPYMARILVKRIRADKRVDFKNDWKLVTLMIGANDFCVDLCYHSEEHIQNSPEIHRKEVMGALDYLRDNLPRTLVNLVIAPSVKVVHEFRGVSGLCTMTHLFECPCMFGKAREGNYEKSVAMQRKWQKVEEEVGKDPKYRKKSDFAVVIQPFTANLLFPQKETPRGNMTDFTYLSEDCFHFSQKGYARAANALWNNMLQPVGQKSTDWNDTFSNFFCPTEEHPYFYTMENSGNPVDVTLIT